MGTISEKLTYLSATKQAIADAIEEKGVSVDSSDTFREYADKIAEIQTGSDIDVQRLDVSENGTYYGGQNGAYNPVVVNIPPVEPDLGILNVSTNGTYRAIDDDLDGYSRVVVDVEGGADLGQKTITANGTYRASEENLDGYSQVTVNVAGGANLGQKTITSNGTYNASNDSLDGFSRVVVNVGGIDYTSTATKATFPQKTASASYNISLNYTSIAQEG